MRSHYTKLAINLVLSGAIMYLVMFRGTPATATPAIIAKAAWKHDDAGHDDDESEGGGDDEQRGVEILMLAPVHDVERPEEVVDAP